MYSDLNQGSSFDSEEDGGGTSRKSLSFPKKYLLLKRVVRYCIIAACTSYCFYFLGVRVKEYLDYRTAVAVNVRFMKELYDILPGITLCSQSKFPLASLECSSTVNRIRSSTQTSNQDKYRQSNDIIEKEVSKILSDVKLGDLSHDTRLTESNQLIKEILCDRTTWRLPGKFSPPSLPDTCNNVFKVRSIERDAGACFTLFHRSALMAMKELKGWNYGRDKIKKSDPEADQMMAFGSYVPPLFPENGLMTIKVNYNLLPASEPNQSTFLSEPYGGMFWVHSSRVIPKMSTVGYRLYPGKRYTVYLKKDIFKLMKYPYQTNCRNYTEEYEEAVLKSGKILDLGTPISQEACIDECVATQVVQHKSCGCWPPVLPFRHDNNSQYRDMKWCNEEKEEFCYSEFVKNCPACLSDCLQEHYEVVIKENKHPDPGSLEMDWDSLSPEQVDKKRKDINMFQPETQIDIVFSSNEETYHEHREDLDKVQLFVNIAGLFGLFVAFSMDYTIDVYEYLRDFIRKRRRVSSLQ